MRQTAILLVGALWLAACAAPIDQEIGQCAPGLAAISADAAGVACTN
jgi:hypothetical protein